MKSIEVVPANQELLKAFYASIPRTLKGVVVVRDGLPVALFGYYSDGEKTVMFSEMKEKISPKVMLREGRKLLKRLKPPVYSLADPSIDGSDRLLKHLGFEHVEGGIFVWRH